VAVTKRLLRGWLEDGRTLAEIGQTLDVSRQYVHRLVVQHGLDAGRGAQVRAKERWRDGLRVGTALAVQQAERRGFDVYPVQLGSRYKTSSHQFRIGASVFCVHETSEEAKEYHRFYPCRHENATYAIYMTPDRRIFVRRRGKSGPRLYIRVGTDGLWAKYRNRWPRVEA
jgi:hypothetical protein